jgi:hypothetical protein
MGGIYEIVAEVDSSAIIYSYMASSMEFGSGIQKLT